LAKVVAIILFWLQTGQEIDRSLLRIYSGNLQKVNGIVKANEVSV